MRYILNNEGYIYDISFGADIYCDLGECKQYAGEIPSGFDSLEQWHDEELERLNAWKIVEGNLVYDENKYNELKAIIDQQEKDNSCVTHKELDEAMSNISTEGLEIEVSNKNEIEKILPQRNARGQIIYLDNSSSYDIPYIEITSTSEITDQITLIANGNNILKNELATTEINGIKYTTNEDYTITITGTATGETSVDLWGNIANTDPLFSLKTGVSYYLTDLPEGVTMEMYSYDGIDRELVYSGTGGVIEVQEHKKITQVTLSCGYVANILTEDEDILTTEAGDTFILEGSGTVKEGSTIYPMLNVGNTPLPYEKYKANKMVIDLGDNTLSSSNKVVVENEKAKIGDKSISYDELLHTYYEQTTIYSIEDVTLNIKYLKSSLFETVTGTGQLILENTYEGIGTINKLVIYDVTAGNKVKLVSKSGENIEEYELDLTEISGTVDIAINKEKVEVIKGDSVEDTLEDIYIKTFDNYTLIYVENNSNVTFECEYMLKSTFTDIFCTIVQQEASFKVLQDLISLEVSRATAEEGTIKASLTIEANKIAQIVRSVGNDGKVTAASIVSAINDGASSIKIEADHIDIEGLEFPTITNSAGTSYITTTNTFETGKTGIKARSPYLVLTADTQIRLGNINSWADPTIIINTSYGEGVIVYRDTDVYGDLRVINGRLILNGVEIDGTAKFG